MTVLHKSYRYELPKKAIKADCPNCGPKHRKTLSQYVDALTGEPLPIPFGRCDRESKCGYHISPYHKGPSGLSYANEVSQGKKESKPLTKRIFVYRKRAIQPAKPKRVYTIPVNIFNNSLSHYEHNQLAYLLEQQFGQEVADSLLKRFKIGTSTLWPGACVFWNIDEQGRIRGGQIKLFNSDWHTVKYIDRVGHKRSKTSWVHSSLKRHLEKLEKPLPTWLIEYEEKADCAPCLFGLPQLQTDPKDKPVAIVEAPKTAVICTYYIPDYIWLAVGGKSYLNAERLAPLRGRRIMLYPDLNAFADWSKRAETLRAEGFMIEVSPFLEENATDKQKQDGLDIADFLLPQSPTINQPNKLEKNEATIDEPYSATPFILPDSLEYRWKFFGRPPFCWNKIATYKALMRCVSLDESRQIVTSIEQQFANPGAILKLQELQLERLRVEPQNNYPSKWDTPNPPNAVPIIRQQTFHEFQQQEPHFSQLGIKLHKHK